MEGYCDGQLRDNGVRTVRTVRALIGHWKKKLRFFEERLGGVVPKGGLDALIRFSQFTDQF